MRWETSNHSHRSKWYSCGKGRILAQTWGDATLKDDVVISVRVQHSTKEALKKIASDLEYASLSQFLRDVLESFVSHSRKQAGHYAMCRENAYTRQMDELDRLAEQLSKDYGKT